MRNFLNANAGVTLVTLFVALVNATFAAEGGAPLPGYMRTVYGVLIAEAAIWTVCGICWLIWRRWMRRDRRRLGILRYDALRGVWYLVK